MFGNDNLDPDCELDSDSDLICFKCFQNIWLSAFLLKNVFFTYQKSALHIIKKISTKLRIVVSHSKQRKFT